MTFVDAAAVHKSDLDDGKRLGSVGGIALDRPIPRPASDEASTSLEEVYVNEEQVVTLLVSSIEASNTQMLSEYKITPATTSNPG